MLDTDIMGMTKDKAVHDKTENLSVSPHCETRQVL
jgi:hypothetical protein